METTKRFSLQGIKEKEVYTIEVTAGTKVICFVDENPSTGYQWSLMFFAQFFPEDVETWVEPIDELGEIGGLQIRFWSFTAKSSGNFELLSQRAWSSSPPNKEIKVSICLK